MKNITKNFPGVTALNKVSFNCLEGEVHALMGENGAGKSTLMKILSGAYQQDDGQIVFLDHVLGHKTPHEIQEAGIATIYQELNLIPHLNISENIFLGREMVRGRLLNRKSMRRAAHEIMLNMGIDIDVTIPVDQLSVGEQQMVEIAKAVSREAKLIIMDEPTAALSEHEVRFLTTIIRSMKSKGLSIVYISHRMDEVFEIADRVTVLKDGRFVATTPIDQIDKAALICMMVGREMNDYYPERKGVRGGKIMEVKNLTRKKVLKDISFDVYRGEILGIAGLIGAGRTELARAIFGADRVDGGEIIIDGKKATINKPLDAINLGLGFATEDRKTQGLILKMSVRKNLTLPLLRRISPFSFIQLRKEKSVVKEYIDRIRIKTHSMDVLVNNLSGGNQQKVVLAKWLAMKCGLIILDEPTRGIDVGAKREIYELMRQMASQGTAIIMISSEMEEVLGVSDRILVMHGGEITGELVIENATEEKIMWHAAGERSELQPQCE
ncbi:MAG: sugar ABC transporter ATP-binding protein [Rectinemataceae bacterium]